MTFSHSGKNDIECRKAAARGVNVAYVFKDKLPKKFNGLKVINGDKHDLRFKDPSGVIVGLVAKGLGRKVENDGFIKSYA